MGCISSGGRAPPHRGELFKGAAWRGVPVQVDRVYDGDTVWCNIAIPKGTYAFRCRLAGIDAPEMKPRLCDPNAPQVRLAAAASKDHLTQLLRACGPKVVADFDGVDKYGRPLVTFGTVNSRMVLDGHAVAYDGGTKGVPVTRKF
jgi:endonuclease YncB( thermonuclease family)